MLLIAAAVDTVVTVGHSVQGAQAFRDPGHLHMILPALIALAVAGALSAIYLRWPGWALGVLAASWFAVAYVAIFGVFHGLYGHALKEILLASGAPRKVLQEMFRESRSVEPTNLAFEVTGLLSIPVAVFVVLWLVRFVQSAWSGACESPANQEQAEAAGAGLRLTPTRGGILRLVDLALRMLFDAPFKSLGTLIGVVVSVFLMAQQTSMLMGILGRVTSFVNSSDVDIWICSLSTESTDATDTIPVNRVGAAASTPGVAWAAPIVQGIGKVTRPDGVREFVKVLGVEAPRYAGMPRTLAPGTTRESLRASRRVLVNWNDRATFASAVPGDRIEIDGQAGIVAGFFQGMDPHSPYYYMFANIDDARAFTEFPLDRITYVAVGLAPGEDVDAVKQRLQARLPDVLVASREEMKKMEERYFLVRTPVGLVFGLGSLIAAVIGAAIVAVTLYSSAVDRSRDYGTFKAIGARQRDILELMLVQAWIYFAIGYVIGLCGFFVVKLNLPQLPMVTPARLFVGVGIASLVSCTLSSLAAIRRVLSLDPAIVFRA